VRHLALLVVAVEVPERGPVAVEDMLAEDWRDHAEHCGRSQAAAWLWPCWPWSEVWIRFELELGLGSVGVCLALHDDGEDEH
jgi:hypothetical protein